MFNVGSGEFLVIFLLALIVLGPDKLPETARKVGKVIGDLRQMSSGFQAEMREAMDVDSIKQALNPTTMMNGSSTETPQYNQDLPAAAIPVSQDPNVPAPIPAPMPVPEPTEIRAAAPPEVDDVDEPTPPPASLPTAGATDIHTSDAPPAKGQQGAA